MKFAISGKSRSGKDTIADYLTKYGFTKYSFAKPLKEMAISCFGCTSDEVYNTKPSNVRNCLISLGKAGRDYDLNFWVNKCLSKIEKDELAVISDLRYLNEAEILKKNGFILIRVNRDVEDRRQYGISNTEDLSETELDNYDKFDYIIDNIGLTKKELFDIVDDIFEKEIEKCLE